MTEFNRWLPIHDSDGNLIRNFTVFLLGDNVKGFEDRKNLILSWRKSGGVLLMGYDMYRIFLKAENGKQNKAAESKKVLKRAAPDDNDTRLIRKALCEPGPDLIICDEGHKIKSLKTSVSNALNQIRTRKKVLKRAAPDDNDTRLIRKALCEPGPDLIICDEGHKIKSLKTSVSNALNQIRTRRRIVLTGYPLQNNLLEYYCMVNFVRPNYLGSKKEFFAMYDRPIKNGQCLDSTPRDIKIAQQKIYLLTQALRGFVQRRSAHLLKKILPQNLEYVIILRKTPIQHALYRAFVLYTKIEMYSAKTKYYNPLKAYSIGTKIWNHPDLLYYAYQKQRNEKGNGSSANGNGTSVTSNSMSLSSSAERMRILQTNTITDYFQIFPNSSTNDSVTPKAEPKHEVIDVDDVDLDDLGGEISYEWAAQSLSNYELTRTENSNKFVIAFELLKETVAKGEKMLLFSSSVMTLNLIENVLSTIDLDMKDETGTKITWRRGLTYCKFDGSTPATEREKLINRFNSSPKQHLFLISTKAGSLGINLVSANRVIIFDASWNPCHDAQAVCRVYRYGQQKKTFVYRLVMHNSMEKAIFYRQISKHGLQQKVVDELEVEAKITNKQLEDLLQYDESLDVITKHFDPTEWNLEDEVLKNVAYRYTHLIAEAPFLHESMILEAEEKLTPEEKVEAELFMKREKSMQNGYGSETYGGSTSAYNGSINLSRRPDFDAMVREYNQQNMVYRGSLRDLQGGMEYSELGLNPLQYKISNPNAIPIQQQQSLHIPLHHPIHGKNSGSLFQLNNASVTKGIPKHTYAVIDEDFNIPTFDGKPGRLFKGEQVSVIKTSDKTYLKKRSTGDIYNATGTRYDHRIPDNSVIELD
uniref:Helicase C-terminal domain-containing protein n=1 Tax=Panagrolaimus sp. ES5 TaxID=591445 RepID=A0AC34FUJ7_9BILA